MSDQAVPVPGRHPSRWQVWVLLVAIPLTIAEFSRHPRPLRVYESTVVEGTVMVGAEKTPVQAR